MPQGVSGPLYSLACLIFSKNDTVILYCHFAVKARSRNCDRKRLQFPVLGIIPFATKNDQAEPCVGLWANGNFLKAFLSGSASCGCDATHVRVEKHDPNVGRLQSFAYTWATRISTPP